MNNIAALMYVPIRLTNSLKPRLCDFVMIHST